MNGSYITTDTNILKRDKETFSEQMECLKKEARELLRQAEALPAMWEGPASETFASQMKQDYNRIAELCNAFGEYLVCMEDAGKDYIQCENDVADMISALRI